MIKIAFDARLYAATGIGTLIKNLLRELKTVAHLQWHLFCKRDDAPFIEGLGFNQITLLRSPLYSFSEHIELSLKIPKCDLYWSPHFVSSIFPVKARKRITSIQDTYHLDYGSEFPWIKRMSVKSVMKKAIASSDLIVTISEFSKRQIESYFPKSAQKIKIAPCAAAPFFTHIKEHEKLKSVKEKYGLPDRFIFTLGNFKPHKNLHRLLEAFRPLSDQCTLVLIGPAKIKEKGVLVLPYLNERELLSIYQLATFLVFPSLYEGFGIPPIEAMACGCPVLVSQAACLPEVCQEAAEYLNPHSVDSIRQGIGFLLHNRARREELIEKGYERCKVFSWQKSAQSYLDWFEQLASA